jgi:hypothetical protein
VKITNPQNSDKSLTSKSPFQSLDTSQLPIGLFYDARYSEPWNLDSGKLTNYLNQTLKAYGLTVLILNSTELRSFLEKNQLAIIIITMGLAPDTIWNGTENSFIETWLDGGGIIIWTGCEEFYWLGTSSGQNIPIGHIGAKFVFDMDYLRTISNLHVTPTDMGNELFLNIGPHSTDIFSSISSLAAEKVYFEVYARNGDLADPIMFQPKDGKGYFVRIHADWDNQLPISNLSTWISSFVYNRFFHLPFVVGINSVDSIYFSTSRQLLINVTNFSKYSKLLLINSTSLGFILINFSTLILPGEKQYISLSINLSSAARFQTYALELNFFSNYTNYRNETKIVPVFSKIISIEVQSPILLEILTYEAFMYPGNIYSITCFIQKNINASIPVDIILICEGCINEQKLARIIIDNSTTFQITFSIQLMAKPGSYELFLRIYQNEVLYSSSTKSIEIYSLFQNQFFMIGLIFFSIIAILLLGYYFYKRNKHKSLDYEIISVIEPVDMINLKNLSKSLNLDISQIQKSIKSCLRRKLITGYLVQNEVKEVIYVKGSKLQNFVFDTLKKLKINDINQLAEILNLAPSELERIFSEQIK